MALPLVLPATLTAGTPQNVNDLNSNLTALTNQINASLPQCRVYASGTQSISSGASPATAVTFNTEVFDTGTPSNNMHDTGSNTSRITCRVAGLYFISAQISFATVGGSYQFMMEIVKNGTTKLSTDWDGTTMTTSPVFRTIHTMARLAVDDYVEIYIGQNSGGAVNTNVGSGNQSPVFQAFMISQ